MKSIASSFLTAFNLLAPPKKDKSDANWVNKINHQIARVKSGRLSVDEIISAGLESKDYRVWQAVIETRRLNVGQLIVVGNEANDIRVWTSIVNTGSLSRTEMDLIDRTVARIYRVEKGIEFIRSAAQKLSGRKP